MCCGERYSALLSVTASKGNNNEEKRYSVDRLMGNMSGPALAVISTASAPLCLDSGLYLLDLLNHRQSC